jgi:hypothetical protein
METLRLRRLQHPSEVERLLELYISSRGLLPQSAYPIREVEGVPKELRRVLTQAKESGGAWSCWAQGVRTWVFIAEMSLALSRERGTPVLHIKCYSDDLLEDSGTWTTDQRGVWHRCTY